jgi:hypothetical protein
MLLAAPAFADVARIETYKTQLRAARPAELPRETARLVSTEHADAADAVSAAIGLHGASPQLIVASVAKASPSSAASAAAAALSSQSALTDDASLRSKLTAAITKAAVSAAPSELSDIIAKSCKVRPAAFYTIGVTAAEAAPRSSDRVIPAITSAVPALKPIIQRSQNDFKAANRSASLALVLKHAEELLGIVARDLHLSPEALLASETETSLSQKLLARADTLPPAPVQHPPFVGGNIPGEVPAGNTTPVAPTDRNYSAP